MSDTISADEWNALHAVGTHVRYYPVLPTILSAPPVDSKTRSEAWTLGHGAVVVSIEGKSGGVLISHLQVLSNPPKDETVAWVEILAGNIHCPCGHVTERHDAGHVHSDLVGHPKQTCQGCGATWFCPAAADCEKQ